ncbi:MAG: radical SAM family heme chaperone HemW [Spirochaetales bacterium]|nr:radical SAM family heme chaperone HemW [Spirochaetales bacterium]
MAMKTDSSPSLQPHPHDNALYVHVPFCRRKCRYCDFFSIADADRETMQAVVRAEIDGIDRFADALAVASIDTVYIGGGTPSLLPGDLLERLLARIGGAWRPVEWTVEANPESLSRDFIDVCARTGVTRISLGVQTFDDRLLRFLGRAGTAAHNRRALDLLAARWPGELSLDLIVCIPTQTVAGALRDLEGAVARAPGHVSLYDLTLEEGTPLFAAVRSGECAQPTTESEIEVWRETRSFLTASGYRPYEVSNFARPGKECLHNLRYWRLDPYIGVGPGAASTVPGADGTALRLETTQDLRQYCAADPLSALSVERLSAGALLLEQLMMGLRLEDGIERSRIARRFGAPLEELLGGAWDHWLAKGWVRADESAYACTDEGRLCLNPLLREAAGSISGRSNLKVVWP